MSNYEVAYKQLNEQQKKAVDTIDGPLLVLAGPGTGKTQLLSVRVAHILEKTDTLAQNILCLTFTENGAQNMRDRLSRFIGQDAYKVNIGTYHAFGSELIKRFPEAFADLRLQTAIDDLSRYQVLQKIVDSLPHAHPLKQLRHHLGDLVSTISEVKRANLTAHDLRNIAQENANFIQQATQAVQSNFADFIKMPSGIAKALPVFEQLLIDTQPLIPAKSSGRFGSLGAIVVRELAEAIAQASTTQKTKPLTAWKNTWLAKDTTNKFVLDGMLQNRRVEALADVLDMYQIALQEQGWYDFDDMILRTIEALEKNPDLRYTLHEQYLYILLDEFQDTNAAQLKLVQLLSNNPVLEGRPNIMAVGDDDQAIYAFQGAQYSNMLDFFNMYRDVTLCSLNENYRSQPNIISTANNVSSQIISRLNTQFDVTKELVPAAKQAATQLERVSFLSDVAQCDWIAHKIKTLIGQGVPANEIAIIAPKHKYLEPLLPYLAEQAIPIRYEKRENILEAPLIKQILSMCRLLLALSSNNYSVANALWPEVLSFDFWHINTSDLWQLSWSIADAPHDETPRWSQALLESDNAALRAPALLLLGLAGKTQTETCEQILDYLIGTTELTVHDEEFETIRSPLRSYYVGSKMQTTNASAFYDAVSELIVLRARLRDYATQNDKALLLQDLLNLVELYEAAGQTMINSSPYNQQAEAVQLMTVFKAKGLEFKHVFLPTCHDDVWGGSSRNNSNKLTLPANLSPIRHAGANDDERLRILYVAMTRARQGLYLTSFSHTFTGKETKHLQYFNEQQQDDSNFKALILPEVQQTITTDTRETPNLKALELTWQQRHTDPSTLTTLHGLLEERLQSYQFSPTHLTHFIDLEYGGPESFFFSTLLRFPEASSADSLFGQAIHATLEWVQHQTDKLGHAPTTADALNRFKLLLQTYKLPNDQYEVQLQRGENALSVYLQNRSHIFKKGDKAEYNFYREGVIVDGVHMGGKIDRMEIDEKTKTITVVDYKTGTSFSSWVNNTKLHKNKLQLYCYKLLIENSHTFKNYKVNIGRLEFVEPDSEGDIHQLELPFGDQETERVMLLIKSLWQHVHALDFIEIAEDYEPTLAGIKKFEQSLIESIKD